MKTIYLHIGVHKTASTALQAFLEENQELLGQNNFYVIKALEGHKLYSCFLYHHPWRAFLNAETVRSQWLESFSKRLENINQDNILISSEFFCVLYKHLIEKLHRLLSPYHVKIICYVRRQDLWLESFYQELVKAEPVFAPPFQRWVEMLPPFPTMICNSYSMLKDWAQTFGKENLTVRPFEKQQLTNNSIFDDFLSLLGLQLTDDYKMPDSNKLNPSLSKHMIEFLRIGKHIPLESRNVQVSAGRPKYIFSELVDLAPKSAKIPKGKGCSFFSPGERLKIIRQYEPNNKKIARDFLNRDNGKLFYEPLSESDSTEQSIEPHRLDFQDMTTTFIEMIYNLNKRTEEFENKQGIYKKRLMGFRHPVRATMMNTIKWLIPDSMYSFAFKAWNKLRCNIST
ncbi:MAG: hypothetical protein ACYSUK_10420 [Planctomycetota bacterium]|jgi:hypothetical protein